MYNAFISVVVVIDPQTSESETVQFLNACADTLEKNFSDSEIILVDNLSGQTFSWNQDEVSKAARQSCSVLVMSSPVSSDHAVVAGLDRANGDYTLIFSARLHAHTHLIVDLYKATQQGFDVVVLKNIKRNLPALRRPFYGFFYFLMKRFSDIRIDRNIRLERILSRRALNWVLKMREYQRYTKGLLTSVGFKTHSLEIDGLPEDAPLSFSEQLRTGWTAITSYTSIPLKVLAAVIMLSSLFLIGVFFNALAVRFWGVDLFGTPQAQVPGWTFLVVLLSIFFLYLNVIFYIFGIYISNIQSEIKRRPLYIIESIKRL